MTLKAKHPPAEQAAPEPALEDASNRLLESEFVKAVIRQRDTAFTDLAQKEAEVSVLSNALMELRNILEIKQQQIDDLQKAAPAATPAPPGKHPMDRDASAKVPTVHRNR